MKSIIIIILTTLGLLNSFLTAWSYIAKSLVLGLITAWPWKIIAQTLELPEMYQDVSWPFWVSFYLLLIIATERVRALFGR